MSARDHAIVRLPSRGAGGAGHLQIVAAPAPGWTSPAAEATATEAVARRHVVAVDDAPEIRELLVDLLQSEGYRVSAFATLPAIEALAELAPDAIVLDLLYNGESVGLGFIAAMRAESAFRSAPIVVCTGASDVARQVEAELARLDVGVVLKPFDIETLLSEIASRLPPPA